jgi:hypothetical protein
MTLPDMSEINRVIPSYKGEWGPRGDKEVSDPIDKKIADEYARTLKDSYPDLEIGTKEASGEFKGKFRIVLTTSTIPSATPAERYRHGVTMVEGATQGARRAVDKKKEVKKEGEKKSEGEIKGAAAAVKPIKTQWVEYFKQTFDPQNQLDTLSGEITISASSDPKLDQQKLDKDRKLFTLLKANEGKLLANLGKIGGEIVQGAGTFTERSHLSTLYSVRGQPDLFVLYITSRGRHFNVKDYVVLTEKEIMSFLTQEGILKPGETLQDIKDSSEIDSTRKKMEGYKSVLIKPGMANRFARKLETWKRLNGKLSVDDRIKYVGINSTLESIEPNTLSGGYFISLDLTTSSQGFKYTMTVPEEIIEQFLKEIEEEAIKEDAFSGPTKPNPDDPSVMPNENLLKAFDPELTWKIEFDNVVANVPRDKEDDIVAKFRKAHPEVSISSKVTGYDQRTLTIPKADLKKLRA